MSVSSKWQISRTSELRFCLEKYPKMWMLIYSVHRLFEILETPKVGWKFYKILTYSISKLSNGFQQRLEVDLKFKKKKIIKLMSSGKKKVNRTVCFDACFVKGGCLSEIQGKFRFHSFSDLFKLFWSLLLSSGTRTEVQGKKLFKCCWFTVIF